MKENTKRARAKARSFAGQHDDEQVILVEHRHPIVMRRQLIVGMLIILVGLLPWAWSMSTASDLQWLANWFLFIAVAILVFYWLRTWVGWFYTVYVLTNTRIMIVKQRGFFNREVSELNLHNVQNVNYKINGLQASLFGYGNITIETLSGGNPLQLKTVSKPVRLQQAILEVIHRTNLDK